MKRSLSLIVAIVFMLGILASCSGGGTKDAASNAPTAAPSTQATVAPTVAPTTAPYELKVSVAGSDTPGLEELATEYESQNPGAKITISRIKDPGQYTTLLNTQLATNDAPDIFYLWPGLTVRDTYLKGNYLEDLSDLAITKKIGAGLLAPFTYGGKTYVIPSTSYFLGVFYNKDVFAKAGVQVPTDWKQFEQVADTIKKMNIIPIELPIKDFPEWVWFQAVASTVYAKDPKWTDERMAGTVKFATSPGWLDAAAKFKDMFDKGYVEPDSLGVTYAQNSAAVISGKAAMYIDGNWALPTIKDAAAKANTSIGAFEFPFNDPGQPLMGSASPSTGPAVWSQSKHKAEAKAFIDFLYSDANVQKYVGDGNIPTNQNVKGSPDPIIADIMAQNQKNGTYPFLDAVYPAANWGNTTQTSTQLSVGGKADWNKTLVDMDALWDKTVAAAAASPAPSK